MDFSYDKCGLRGLRWSRRLQNKQDDYSFSDGETAVIFIFGVIVLMCIGCLAYQGRYEKHVKTSCRPCIENESVIRSRLALTVCHLFVFSRRASEQRRLEEDERQRREVQMKEMKEIDDRRKAFLDTIQDHGVTVVRCLFERSRLR